MNSQGFVHKYPSTRRRTGGVAGILTVVVAFLLTACVKPTVAGGWATYRYDNARSGVSPEPLEPPLSLHWTYVPRHGPRPAWPEPGKEMHRMPFDYAYQVSVGDGLIFFGSSADHKIHALDLETGKERWSFFTEAPVRFAPAVSGDRLFAASDDGCLYCLSAGEGELLWQFRGGPRDERLIGNDQMISRWPARAGALVDGETVFFTAGMWSPDGVYVYALRARDGSIIWENDTSGQFYMGLPHSSLEGIAGVAPQGYLALYKDTLIVPNGRAEPAAFDCKTGKLLFCQNASTKLHHAGGSWVIVANDLIFAERRPVARDIHVTLEEASPAAGEGLMAWDYRTGRQKLALVGKHRAVIHGDMMYATGDGTITAVNMNDLFKASQNLFAGGRLDPNLPKHQIGGGRMFTEGSQYPWFTSKVVPLYPQALQKWQTPLGRTYALILAGNTLVAGGMENVTAISAETGKTLWQTAVDGQARGLAAVGGRLIVSTSTGKILCFGIKKVASALTIKPETKVPGVSAEAKANAEKILKQTNIKAGYCLMLGVGDGQLAYELARQSDLVIYCIEPDDRKMTAARKIFDAAGLYGVRVAVQRGSFDNLPYADYFANLVILDETLVGNLGGCSGQEVYRVLRPFGGVAYLSPKLAKGPAPSQLETWLEAADVPPSELHTSAEAIWVVRGALPGAGKWTHKYASTRRPAASDDQHVRLPMKMLWFGGPGPARIVSRHWRTPTPLFSRGRMFIAGEHHLIGMDAYNGRQLWTRELPDVGRVAPDNRGGNIVADENHVYALQGTRCLQLDAETGRTTQTYDPPPECLDLPVLENPTVTGRLGRRARPVPNKIEWEFLAVTEELVIGTIGLPNFAWTAWPPADPEGEFVFALRKGDGKLRWLYTAEQAVSPNAIVLANDCVYLIDRTSRASIERARRRGKETAVRAVLKALDAATGRLTWKTNEALDGRMLWMGQDVLLVTGGRKMSAYSVRDGKLLWAKRIRGQPYPVILGDSFYAYPQAYDLRTGEPKERVHPVTGQKVAWTLALKGGCGAFSGCPTTLFFRSGSAAFCDLANDSGIHWLGQVRASCWINMIPAGGMLLIPEGASCCSCPYNFQTSLAMVPAERYENWSVFPDQPLEPASRIRHLSVNLGAVGEQRAEDGTLWLTYPRPFRPGALMLPMVTSNAPEYYRANADELAIKGTNIPWLYTSGCKGLQRAELDLILNRPAPVLPCAQPPRVDGRLDDACWDGKAPLILTTDNQAEEGPHVVAYLRSDDDNFYVAFRREASLRDGQPVPWVMNTRGKDAPVWNDDSFDVRLWDSGKRAGVYLCLSASGATYDGQTDKRIVHLIGTDKAWNGEWMSAVHVEPRSWTAEIAVPWKTLAEAGVHKNRLSIYIESTNRSGVGPERVQYKYRTWRRLHLFGRMTPVSFGEPPKGEPRTYRVVLHFAELENVKPGQRVFDVKLQGKAVIRKLDIAKEAGGRNVALVREVKAVEARDKLTLELLPGTEKAPIISGMQVYEEDREASRRYPEAVARSR